MSFNSFNPFFNPLPCVEPVWVALTCVDLQLFGPLQEPGWTDWPVRGRLPFTRPTQGGDGGGWSGVAQLRWSFRLLQEVHGAVLPTEHRGTDDRPHNYLPEILERVRLEDPLWKPAEVRRADYFCCLLSKRRKSEQNKQSEHMNMTWLQGAKLTLTGLQTFSKQRKKHLQYFAAGPCVPGDFSVPD